MLDTIPDRVAYYSEEVRLASLALMRLAKKQFE